jgi:hypothetical protein
LIERFFAPRAIHALVFCRIGFGLILFVSYLTKWPHVQKLFGPDGVGGASTLARSPLGSITRELEIPVEWLSGVTSAESIWVLYWILLVASLCFALGFRTRTAGVIALLLHSVFHARNAYAFFGWPVMMKPFMLYVLMAPVGRFGSLDAWLRRHREPLVPVRDWIAPAWPLRLLQVHLCTMYAEAGWSRITDAGWFKGEMVFVALTDRRFGRFDFDWYPYLPLLRPASYVAFILEPLAPLMLWLRVIGPLWALALIALHLGLEIFANVGWWQFMMMTTLSVFLPTEWLSRGFEACGRAASRLRPARSQ